MAIRALILNSIDCFVSGNAERVVLINCSGMNTAPVSGYTYIQNGRVLPTLWTTATASAPTTVTGDFKTYETNTSGGDANFIMDIPALNGNSVSMLITDATNDIVIQTTANTQLINGAVLPKTITGLTIYDVIEIWSDGTNLFYTKASATSGGGGGGFSTLSANTTATFLSEENSIVTTVASALITAANFKTFAVIPTGTTATSLDDFTLNGVTFNIENIVDGVSFDIRASAINNATGVYSFKYIITYN